MASGLNKTHHTAADFPRSFDMSEYAKSSKIELPPLAWIKKFGVWQCGDDRIEDYLAKGWSLGLVCKDCTRLIEWTPYDLQTKFGSRPRLRIAELVPRLKCSGEAGCGSTEIAVFPHLYDHFWRLRDAAQTE